RPDQRTDETRRCGQAERFAAPTGLGEGVSDLKTSWGRYNSAHIKMLFGLVMCQLCFSNTREELTDPDFTGTSVETCTGNLASPQLKHALEAKQANVEESDLFRDALKYLQDRSEI
ncbi:MAG: hypothetical protein AAGF56_06820, partial [Pseudomonadota bacterium]